MFIGVNKKANFKGLTLYFDQIMEIRETEFFLTFKTMTSFFGGIVGYSKNILWLIILMFSYLSIIFNKSCYADRTQVGS